MFDPNYFPVENSPQGDSYFFPNDFTSYMIPPFNYSGDPPLFMFKKEDFESMGLSQP